MGYLFLYLIITVVGYLIGSRMKRRSIRLSWVGPVQTITIIVLVFLMGSRIGANDEIVASLDSIGIISFLYTLIIMACTCAAFTLTRRAFGFDRYGRRDHKDNAKAGQSGGDAPASCGGSPAINSLTLMIVAFVAAGIIAGRSLIPESIMQYTGSMLTVCLCILLILIGVDIGTEGTLAANFRSAGWRVIVFPFVSMAAMIIGAAAASIVLPLSMQDSLCIGSGLGWYSLAPAMLAEYSVRVSAISFMHNVFREIIGILLIPIAARHIGFIESYGLPGSPSMDVCLPVVERATNGDVAVYSFINGAILSAAVPILVSIFMSL